MLRLQCLLVEGLLCLSIVNAAQGANLRVHVEAPSGIGQIKAEVAAVSLGDKNSTAPLWHQTRDGMALIAAAEVEKSKYPIELIARAKGLAPRTLRLTHPPVKNELTMRLETGRRIELKLNPYNETPIPPSLEPVVGYSRHLKALWWGLSTDEKDRPAAKQTFSVYPLEQIAPGHFAMQFAADAQTTELIVLISEPGYLRAFQTNATRPEDWQNATIEFDLPEPAVVQARYETPSDRNTKRLNLKLFVERVSELGYRIGFIPIGGVEDTEMEADDLAPGQYAIQAFRNGIADSERGDFQASEVSNPVHLKPLPKLPPVRLLAADGKPVSGAEFAVRQANGFGQLPDWRKTDNEGIAEGTSTGLVMERRFGPHINEFELLARAPGYAPGVSKVELPTSHTEILVTLHKGKPYEIQLQAPSKRPLPDNLQPIIALENHLPWAWQEATGDKRYKDRDMILFPTQKTGPDRWTFTAAAETSPIHVLVNHPGFLLGYQSEPITSEQLASDPVRIVLPVPGKLEATFAPSAGVRPELHFAACGMELTTGSVVTGNVWVSAALVKHSDQGASTTKTFASLAPGNYELAAFSGTPENRYSTSRDDEFNTGDGITIESGRTTTCSLTYDPYDPEKLKGNCSVEVTVTAADGSPATRRPYSVIFLLPNIGQKIWETGILSEHGTFTLQGVTCGKDSSNPMLVVDNEWLGRIKLNTDETSPTANFKMPVKAGMMAPDIGMLDPVTSQVVMLSDFRGKVVLLDFWATWCGPCQEPMAHNSKLVATKGDDWKDRVAILGVSIDEDPETLMTHVKKNGWENVRQLWCHEGEAGFKADAPRAYTISGIPTALVINANGQITWRGHPGPGIEEEIEKALKLAE